MSFVIFNRSVHKPIIAFLILVFVYNLDIIIEWPRRNDNVWQVTTNKTTTKRWEQQLLAAAANSRNGNATTITASASEELVFLTRAIYEAGHNNVGTDMAQLCPKNGTDLKLLVIVMSAPMHFEARQAIRDTWGHKRNARVSAVFMLGRSTNESLQLAVNEENAISGDLIRGHFIDTYANLTLKTISALEWVRANCAQVAYVLKADDDVFVNVAYLLKFLDNYDNGNRTIFGRVAKRWKPIRNRKSKYYVSAAEFNATVFPPFTIGPAYVLSGDIIHDLYNRSLEEQYLKLEDVFITGIVSNLLDIPRTHVPSFLNKRITHQFLIRKAISVHMVAPSYQYQFWKIVNSKTF